VRFEGLPGEFSQHDFGHVDVTFVDGRKKRLHFFASRLKYSRYARVTLVDVDGHQDPPPPAPRAAFFDVPLSAA
jgi:hypothetical protein